MRLAELMYRFRFGFLTLLIVLGGASLLVIPELRTEVDFSRYFPEGDQELEFFQDYQRRLGSEDDYLSVAVVSPVGIFDSAFLTHVQRLTDTCKQMDGIRSANSITTLRRAIRTPMGILQIPYLKVNSPRTYARDSLKIMADSVFTGRYVFPRANTLVVLLELESDLPLPRVEVLIQSLRSVVREHDFPAYHLGGVAYLQASYNQILRDEFTTSIWMSVSVIALMLILLFRSVAGSLLPLLSMVLALILFYGVVAMLDRPLGILSSLFPTIVLVVGISDVIHIAMRFQQETARDKTRRQAIIITMRVIGLATFLTSATTALGFLTLRTSSMPGLRDFGLGAAIAVLITFLVSILVVPAVLSTFRSERAFFNQALHSRWERIAFGLYRLTRQHKGYIIGATLFLLGIAVWGISRMDMNNKLMMSVPSEHAVGDDYRFYDQQLGGIRTLELAVVMKGDRRLNQLPVLRELHMLHRHLEQAPGINQLVSPVSYYQGLHQVMFPGSREAGPLPARQEAIEQAEDRLQDYTDRLRYRLVDTSRTLGRITMRMEDPGRLAVGDWNNKLTTWIHTHIDTSMMSIRPSGTSHIIDRGHEHRIANMFEGLAIALAAVALIMGLLLRSVPMILLSLAVNLVPLILTAGVMGFLGIELRGTSSIIFTVGFVIAVDDTIHFLTQFASRMRAGMARNSAIELTIRETGQAIVTTTLILLGGFLVLLHSELWEIYIHGLLLSLVLAFALLADLLLMPVLLTWVIPSGSDRMAALSFADTGTGLNPLVLVNLGARHGGAQDLWHDHSSVLKKLVGPRADFHEYHPPHDLAPVLHESIKSGKNCFICCGGDGSVHYVLNVLMRLPDVKTEKLTMGAIGLGSSNDFTKPARSRVGNLPVRISPTGSCLADVGKVEYRRRDGSWAVRYFIVNASVGVTAEANLMFSKGNGMIGWLQQHLPGLAIPYAALKALFAYQSIPVGIRATDGKGKSMVAREMLLTNLAVLKNPHVSGSFVYDQDIAPDDGWLGLNVCSDLNTTQLLGVLWDLRHGRFSGKTNRVMTKARVIELEPDRFVALETDGEVVETDFVRFSLSSRKIGLLG